MAGDRSRLVDAVSASRIERQLALQAYERVAWGSVHDKMRAWHEYQVARIVETAAEDALFAHDLAAHGKAVR